MQPAAPLRPKLEESSPLSCKFCLAGERAARLTRRDLTHFYALFRACGLGLNIVESQHYNWVCQYCWVRAAQCISFIECARNAELVLNGVLKNEDVTHEKLHKFYKDYIRPPVELSIYISPPNDIISTYDICQQQYLDIPKTITQDSGIFAINIPQSSGIFALTDDNTVETSGIFATSDIGVSEPSNVFGTTNILLPDNRSIFDTNVDVPQSGVVYSTTGVAEPHNDEDPGVFTTINVVIPHNLLPDPNEILIAKYGDVNELLTQDDAYDSGHDEERTCDTRQRQRDKYAKKKTRRKTANKKPPNRKSKELREKLPRKDPAELVEKWKSLQVEVINLSESEQREEIEQRKLTDKYRSWKYRCDKCGVGYHEEDCIEKHNQMHLESRGEYVCNICLVRFAKPHQLSSHSGNHRRRWRCLRCGEMIMKSAYLMPHHAKCTNSAPVTCEQCGKFFSNKLRMRKHVSKSHNAPKKYMCDICGRAFKEKQQIKHHMRIHTGEMPYQCDLCGKKSSTLTSHRLHMTVHNEQTQSPETYCVECDQYFKNKYILRIHFKQSQKHVSRDTYQHPCAECPERFVGSSALRIHMNTVHLKNRTYACSLCDKAYFTQGALTAHVKEKHTEGARSKDYMCSVCSRAFVTNGQLKQHMRTHTKERPYACLLCPATFGFNSALYTHNKLKHKMTTAELHKKLNVPKRSHV